MRTLTLSLKRQYFYEIVLGEKTEEYRRITPHWTARLKDKTFDEIVLTMGYPKSGDAARRVTRPWRGYTIKTITHPHFGPDPVEVYAIRVN